ncbi:MAG: acyl-CoA dehydrogenase family protein [Bacteroidota bacterium]
MQAAIAIAKQAEERKEEIEKSRNLPTDLIDQAKVQSLPRMWVAEKYGGSQQSVEEVMKTWQKMAYHNGSLAWVTSVTNCSSLVSGFLPEKLAEKIFAHPHAMVGGFAAPAGIAEPADNGIKVSGNWSWGSGIKHCTHIVGGVKLMKEGVMMGAGLVFLKPEEVTFLDNWHVVGMKGTHSIDYTVKDLFVENDRWIPFPPAKPAIDEPLYRFSFLGALSLSISAIGLGLAERARDEIKHLLQQKTPLGQQKPLSKQPIVQDKIGKIEGNFLAAESLYYRTIADAQAETAYGPCSMEMKGKIRLAACTATQLCLSVVRDAYEMAGGSAIWETNKLEELHRDMHVVSQHAMASDANFRTAGALSLGSKVPEFLL